MHKLDANEIPKCYFHHYKVWFSTGYGFNWLPCLWQLTGGRQFSSLFINPVNLLLRLGYHHRVAIFLPARLAVRACVFGVDVRLFLLNLVTGARPDEASDVALLDRHPIMLMYRHTADFAMLYYLLVGAHLLGSGSMTGC